MDPIVTQRLDRNNDGYISRSEWPGSRDGFDRLDLNNDNRVSRSEVERWLQNARR